MNYDFEPAEVAIAELNFSWLEDRSWSRLARLRLADRGFRRSRRLQHRRPVVTLGEEDPYTAPERS
jgi:hypothetical protein